MNENEKILRNIMATMKMEGFNLNTEDLKVLNNYLENNMNEEEIINNIKSDYLN